MTQNDKRSNRSYMESKDKLAMAIISIVLIIGVIKSFSMVSGQHRKISSYIPVKAEVLSSEVGKSYSGRRNTRVAYYPIVHYKYQVNDSPYNSSKVYPVTLTLSHSWAQGIADQYKPGDVITIYHDPLSPGNAFIIPQYTFFTYFMVMFFALLASLFPLGFQKTLKLRSNPPPPRPAADGTFIIKPHASIQRRRLLSAIYLVIVTAIVLPCFSHFLSYSRPPYGKLFLVCLAVSAALIGLTLVLTIYYTVVSWRTRDAVVFSSTGEFKRGEKIKIEVHQKIKRRLMVKKARLGLMVYHRGSPGGERPLFGSGDKRPVHNDFRTGMQDFEVPAGETICLDVELELPDHIQESTPARSRSALRCEWEFHYELDVEGSFDYKARYPVMVT